jgi:hypothetical protein
MSACCATSAAFQFFEAPLQLSVGTIQSLGIDRISDRAAAQRERSESES